MFKFTEVDTLIDYFHPTLPYFISVFVICIGPFPD